MCLLRFNKAKYYTSIPLKFIFFLFERYLWGQRNSMMRVWHLPCTWLIQVQFSTPHMVTQTPPDVIPKYRTRRPGISLGESMGVASKPKYKMKQRVLVICVVTGITLRASQTRCVL